MTFNFLNAVFRLITLAFTINLLIGCGNKSEEQKANMPQLQIPITEVTIQDVPLTKVFVGQVYGTKDIPIRARVEGYLEGIYFREGSTVKKGQLLYKVDPQQYAASVAMKKGQLAEAEVTMIRASNDLERIQPLAEQNAVSKSDLDAALAEKGASESMVAAAKANLRMAQIEYSYTVIKSPISGIIGKTEAKVGEFVGKDPNPVILNTVSRIDSVNVRFFINENDYLRLARYAVALEKSGKKDFNKNEPKEKLELIFSDNTVYSRKGHIDFIDRNVDETTGAILVQATFPNPDRLIRPGQFAKVRSVIDVVEDGVLVPQRAVSEFQGRNFVFVVDKNNKVSQRKVELGRTYKDYWLVRSGLQKGEKVVLEGLQKVREGTTIKTKLVKFESQYEK